MHGPDRRRECLALRLILSEIALNRRAYCYRLAARDDEAAIAAARAGMLRARIRRLREASHDDARRPGYALIPVPSPEAPYHGQG